MGKNPDYTTVLFLLISLFVICVLFLSDVPVFKELNTDNF